MFEDNGGGVDDAKVLQHDKRWYLYVNEKENIFKGGYLMEVFGHDGRKILLEVANDHVVKYPTDNEIGLQGFNFNFFDEDEKGVGGGGSSEFPYLLILIQL